MAFVSLPTSDMMARLAFSHFFIPIGLPKLVIVERGSEFKGGPLIAMCDQLGVPCCVAPPEARNAILCERFHQRPNKVQERIGAADAQSCKKWAMNCLFAACEWNRSPVDKKDVIRSFAAKVRTFHFFTERPDQQQNRSHPSTRRSHHTTCRDAVPTTVVPPKKTVD